MNTTRVALLAGVLVAALPLVAEDRPYLITIDANSTKALSGGAVAPRGVCPLVGAAAKSRAIAKSVTSTTLTTKVVPGSGFDASAASANAAALEAGRPDAGGAANYVSPDELAERQARAGSGPKRQALQAQIKSLEDRREHLQDTMLDENVDSGTGGEDAVEKEISDINKQIAKLNAEMSALP